MEIKDIFDGISIKLNQEFGADYTIYIDQVPQGFNTPSFLIQLVTMDHVRQIGKRWYVAPLFNVQFFSDEGRSYLANHSLKIQYALEQIELINGDIIIARGQNSELQDDILNNFMRFDFYLNEIQARDYMLTLDLKTRHERVT